MSVFHCRSAPVAEERLSYEDLQTIAEFLRGKTDIKPEVGIICGSGLGGLAENLDTDRPKVVISYIDIPKFPNCLGMVGSFVVLVADCCVDVYRGLVCIQAAVLSIEGFTILCTHVYIICVVTLSLLHVSLFLSERSRRKPCVWLPVWPACGLHAGKVPLLRRTPSMEGTTIAANMGQ